MEPLPIRSVEIEKLDIGYMLTHGETKYSAYKKVESYETLDKALRRAQQLLDPSFDTIWR